VLTAGERAPEARVWTGPNEPVALRDLYGEGTILLLFYLFDWSST
jgi:peroxiredoxin